MKKQIIYSNFIPRLFAFCIDLIIVSIPMQIIMNILSKYIFISVFNDFFVEYAIDVTNFKNVLDASMTPEFREYITLGSFLTYILIILALNYILLGIYFIWFWYRYSATPGKIIMSMRIVDSRTYGKPTIFSLVKRFAGYITAFIGVWSIMFNNQKQAMHDKIAHTVVIKR